MQKSYPLIVWKPFAIILFCVLLVCLMNHKQYRPSFSEKFSLPVKETSVPIRYGHGWPLVDVTINGQGPYTMVLDTGASDILLEESIIEELKLTTASLSNMNNAAGVTHLLQHYAIDRLEIGKAVYSDTTVVKTTLFSARGMPDISGIIGITPFTEHYVTLDFPKSRLVIHKSESHALGNTPWLPVKLTGKLIDLPVEVGDRTHYFHLDTGFSNTFSLSSSTLALLPRYEQKYDESSVILGKDGAPEVVTEYLSRLRENISVGSHVVERPFIRWKKKHAGTASNLIGMKILKNFKIEIDRSNKRVRLSRKAISFSSRKQLGFGITHDNESHSSIVSSVTPSYGAKNNLKVGDRILTINGKNAGHAPVKILQGLMEKEDSISLLIQRGDEEISVDIEVVVFLFE